MNRTVFGRLWLCALGTGLVVASVATAAQNQRRGPGPQGGAPQGRAGRQAPGPGMALFQPGRVMQPEMATKSAQVMALRELHSSRFAAKDVAAALPVLREMHEAEQALQEKSLQALEREKKALLAAGPDDDPPAGAGEALREAAEAHRAKLERLYAKLGEAVGEPKAGVIRRLLGAVMGPPNMLPGGGPGFPGGPGMGMGPGMQPGMPPGPGMPQGPGPGIGPDRPGGGPDLGDAPDMPMIQEPGYPFGSEPSFQSPQGPQGPPAGGRQGPPRGNRQGPGVPGGPGGPGLGQGGPFPGMGGMMGMPPMMGLGPRLSLPELIELLEQKQAAMRK